MTAQCVCQHAKELHQGALGHCLAKPICWCFEYEPQWNDADYDAKPLEPSIKTETRPS